MSSPYRVLLVQLPVPPPGQEPVAGNVPLAAGYLKLHAMRQGLGDSFTIDILPPETANVFGDQGLLAEILSREPGIVGFTCYLWNIDRTLWIAARLKQRRPDLLIVLGGPEITADNTWALRHPAVDFAVLGEGEQTFCELLTALRGSVPLLRRSSAEPARQAQQSSTTNQQVEASHPASLPTIPGLWQSSVGLLPPPRQSLMDLNTVSSPYLEGIVSPDADGRMVLETARGCRFHCKYCYYPKNYGDLRFLSPDQVRANLRYANEHGVSEVVFLDPTLNQRPDFHEFLQLLAQGNPERRFTYSGELRAEGIDTTTARLLREANFHEAEIGLQSIEPKAWELMGRPANLAAFERGVKAMMGEGIKVCVDLIIGLPGDTVDSVRRAIDYLHDTQAYSEVQAFNLSILPGTAFREEAASLGLRYQPRPPYYVLGTPTMNIEQMLELMEEVQEAFGVEFDAPPPPTLEPWHSQVSRHVLGEESGVKAKTSPRPLGEEARVRAEASPRPLGEGPGVRAVGACSTAEIDLDAEPDPMAQIPPAADRAQAFTLWLRASDFDARRDQAAALVGRLLEDNPHTTLQVILEPTASPDRVSADFLKTLLAACYRTPTYLDRYYSMHPGSLLGCKQIAVLLRWEERESLGQAWRDQRTDYATLLWQGNVPEADQELLDSHEEVIPPLVR